MKTVKLSAIVEGQGEEQSVNALMHKLMNRREVNCVLMTNYAPFRIARSRMVPAYDDVSRALTLFAKRGVDGVLVVLDADDDCPVLLAKRVADSVASSGLSMPVAVAVANREFEAWFIAGVPQVRSNLDPLPSNPDNPRDAKGVVGKVMPLGRYSPTADQRNLVSALQPELAMSNSRSFRHLVSAFDHLIDKILGGSQLPSD